MLLQIFSVRDSVTGQYSGLFQCLTNEEARRLFADWNKDPQNAIHSNPADYTLVCVGYFDRDTGEGAIYHKPKEIARGEVSVAEAGSLAEANRLIERLGAEVMNLRQEVDSLLHKEAENK